MFWVNSVYFNIRNTLPKSGTFLLGHPVYINITNIPSLPVVLYGCETWSLTVREKRRLRVFESRVLRRVFGPESDEVRGEWIKLHNDKLNDLYSSHQILFGRSYQEE